jgi:hypothetical protein
MNHVSQAWAGTSSERWNRHSTSFLRTPRLLRKSESEVECDESPYGASLTIWYTRFTQIEYESQHLPTRSGDLSIGETD